MKRVSCKNKQTSCMCFKIFKDGLKLKVPHLWAKSHSLAHQTTHSKANFEVLPDHGSHPEATLQRPKETSDRQRLPKSGMSPGYPNDSLGNFGENGKMISGDMVEIYKLYLLLFKIQSIEPCPILSSF